MRAAIYVAAGVAATVLVVALTASGERLKREGWSEAGRGGALTRATHEEIITRTPGLPITDPVPLPLLAASEVDEASGAAREAGGSLHECPPRDLELITEQAARIEELNLQVRQLQRELMVLRNDPESAPKVAFLRSIDAEFITAPEERRELLAILDDFPVVLRNGEAIWIAERIRYDDWDLFAEEPHDAIVLKLGYQRLKAEMPPDKMATLDLLYDGPR